MGKITTLLGILCFLFFPFSLANAQPSVPIPNFDGWKLVSEQVNNLDVKIQSGGLIFTAYLGFIQEYQNPQDTNEFVRVVRRYIPVTSIINRESKSQDIDSGIVTNYNRKILSDILEKIQQESDPICYTRWRVTKDSRNGQYVLSESPQNWLRIQNGDWVYDREPITRELFSDLSLEGDIVILGIKFSLGGRYHILRVDQVDLIEKKEERE